MVPEDKWWEPSDTELEDMIEDRLEDAPLPSEVTETLHPPTSTETPLSSEFRMGAVALVIGLLSPWGWYGSGIQAFQGSFQDVQWILTDGLSYYSEWGMNPLEYTHWLMGPLLPLVFVTTFVATWYKSREGDEEFGRKASIFHLSFFGVWWLLSSFLWGAFFPSESDYGIFLAAASGIGLHPTTYGRLFTVT